MLSMQTTADPALTCVVAHQSKDETIIERAQAWPCRNLDVGHLA